MVKVTAILVSHDGAKWLPRVIAALGSQTVKPTQKIAVDTGSKDDSQTIISNSNIQCISIERGEGFGTAIAEAVATLPPCESEDEWIWLLHDDCAPKNDALEKLLDAVEARPNVAMVGPKILGWSNPSHLLEVGVSIGRNGMRWTGLEEDEYDQGQHDGVREVFAVSTAGALIRRSVFEELGGFDENLALFRDDLDFGWRIHSAGNTVLVTTEAVLYHAQAAANERREVDVDEAFLHRPHLLDRRNAAYVLLANSTWWMLPLITLQIIGSAMIRSIGYLFAKLPGYASDELLALGQLFIRPDLVRSARKVRREDRLVSPRIVTQFMPTRLTQLRNGAEDFIERTRERLIPSYEAEVVLRRRWSDLFKRPDLLSFIFMFLFSLVVARSRFGVIAGGALPETLHGSSNLWRLYAESWHQVGLGSSSATPTWVAILALIGTLTLGNTQLFVSALFLFAPFILFIAIFIWLNRITSHVWLAISGSLLYALSPIGLAAVNAGRLGTLIVLIFLPITLNLLSSTLQIEHLSIRRIFQLGIFLAIPVAFSLPFLLALGFFYFGLTIFELFNVERSVFLKRLEGRVILLLVPFTINSPYSFEAVLHPTRYLLEPGLSLPGGGPNISLLANPGGIGAPPWWLIAPISFLLIGSIFSRTNARYFAVVGSSFLAIATIFASMAFPAHGQSVGYQLWTGTFHAIATVAGITAGAIVLDQMREHLERHALNFRHFIGIVVLVSTGIYILMSATWSVITNSPLHTISNRVLPEYLGVTPGTRTAVLREMPNGSLNYFLANGKDIYLGDPDVAPATAPKIAAAIRSVVDGTGVNSSETLAEFGVKYLFLKSPAPQNLIRTIDGLGGFARSSSTSSGVVWKILGFSDRLVYSNSSGASVALPTNEVSANFAISAPGTIRLAENYDRAWRIIGGGLETKKFRNADGLTTFTLDKPGKYFLIHDGTSRRGWLSLQIIFLLGAVIMATPSGRRRRDYPEGEMS